MNKELENLCKLTVENYRQAREEFRFDGDYINHYAAIIYANAGVDLPVDKIKKIRTYIKNNTSRMSAFRGDILYLVSFLIGLESNSRIFCEVLLETYDELLEKGFKESQYLVLASYAYVKHGESTENEENMHRMKEIYSYMKLKYNDIINEDDYLECALLSINGIDTKIIKNCMDNIFNSLMDIEHFSKNSLQGLTLSVILNKNESSLIRIEQLLIEMKGKNIRISHQFLPLLAVSAGSFVPQEYSGQVKAIIEKLCNEEYEYEYYMDSSFRTFIAIAILEYYNNEGKEKYLNELLTIGVYSFINSKNLGLMEEVLA